MPEHNLLDRSNSARKAFKILRRLLAEFDGTNDTVIEPTGVERELTGVLRFDIGTFCRTLSAEKITAMMPGTTRYFL